MRKERTKSAEPGGAISLCASAKDRGRNLAVGRHVGFDLSVEESVELVCFSVCSLASSLALQSDIIAAMIVQQGREDLRPVAAARPDLDHGRLRRHAEKGEFLEGMARFVPRDKFLAPRGIADRRFERQLSGGGRRVNA